MFGVIYSIATLIQVRGGCGCVDFLDASLTPLFSAFVQGIWR